MFSPSTIYAYSYIQAVPKLARNNLTVDYITKNKNMNIACKFLLYETQGDKGLQGRQLSLISGKSTLQILIISGMSKYKVFHLK